MDSLAPAAVPVKLYDAHNHLQDQRLAAHYHAIFPALKAERIVKMVVNGSSEADWPAVLELARQYPTVLPSFGLHPWYVSKRSADWLKSLVAHLDAVPAGVGEIGLDRWISGHDLPDQESVFLEQLSLAAERNLPVSIHCLQAWGKLLELLQTAPRPRCGFVLHSFGGPQEMIPRLTELGAYFSFPGYFALPRKSSQRVAFRRVPAERLLIETDAPDQLLPENLIGYPLFDERTGKAINHPANLGAVYRFVAALLAQPLEKLSSQVEENFQRLFQIRDPDS